MTRRLVYILLTVIALQFSWSAVSAYCMHESGRAAQHLGHHPHADEADSGALAAHDGSVPAKKSPAHTHCSLCAHGASALAGLDQDLQLPRLSGLAPSVPLASLSSSYTPPPERPQWLPAV